MTQSPNWSLSLLSRLLRPHPRIQNKEARQSSQLLAGLLLTSFLAVACILALVIYFDPTDLTDTRTLAGFGVIGFSFVFYLLNFFGYFDWARNGFIGMVTLVLLGTPYLGNFEEFIAFAVVPMLLVGMFYPFRWSLAFNVAMVIIIFVLNSFVTDDTIWIRRILWYFLLFAGTLVITFKWHLNRLELIRRNELDKVNSQLAAMLDALPDTLLETDDEGRIINCHSPESLGYTWDRFVGKTPHDMLPESVAKTIMTGFEEANKTGRHSGTSFSIELSLGLRWFEISISAIQNEAQATRFVAIARDITERKQAEELRIEREKLQADFEKEKELAELRSQLISIISHEFRTPLTIILTSSTLLVDYHDRLSSQKRNDNLKNIMLQVKRLDNMLDSVSTFSKVQRGYLQHQVELTDVTRFCYDLLQEFQSLLRVNQTLELKTTHEFGTILLDRNLVRHALTNLLSNAIKYSPDGGSVTLEIGKTNSQILFAVSDEGIGIPEEDMANLFKPFHRASNANTLQGTGLGLSITKEIVEMQGGNIACTSTLGRGTSFRIQLPLKQEENHVQNTHN